MMLLDAKRSKDRIKNRLEKQERQEITSYLPPLQGKRILDIGAGIPVYVEFVLRVDRPVFDIGQRENAPAMAQVVGDVEFDQGSSDGSDAAWRKKSAFVFEVVAGQTKLLHIVDAFAAVGGFADLLHGREQEADQDGDDGDHDQQFDERKCSTLRRTSRMRHGSPEKEDKMGTYLFRMYRLSLFSATILCGMPTSRAPKNESPARSAVWAESFPDYSPICIWKFALRSVRWR